MTHHTKYNPETRRVNLVLIVVWFILSICTKYRMMSKIGTPRTTLFLVIDEGMRKRRDRERRCAFTIDTGLDVPIRTALDLVSIHCLFKCHKHILYIHTAYIYKEHQSHKWSWISPQIKHWHSLDNCSLLKIDHTWIRTRQRTSPSQTLRGETHTLLPFTIHRPKVLHPRTDVPQLQSPLVPWRHAAFSAVHDEDSSFHRSYCRRTRGRGHAVAGGQSTIQGSHCQGWRGQAGSAWVVLVDGRDGAFWVLLEQVPRDRPQGIQRFRGQAGTGKILPGVRCLRKWGRRACREEFQRMLAFHPPDGLRRLRTSLRLTVLAGQAMPITMQNFAKNLHTEGPDVHS